MKHAPKIMYVAKVKTTFEEVVLGKKTALLTRFGRRVVDFVPTKSQREKIRSGKGKINILYSQVGNRYPW